MHISALQSIEANLIRIRQLQLQSIQSNEKEETNQKEEEEDDEEGNRENRITSWVIADPNKSLFNDS